MITVPCYLLARYPKDDRWLVCFNDPQRGLGRDDPCYLPGYACRFAPVDEQTGEILHDNPTALGDGLITMPDPTWQRLPELIARVLEQAARNAAADRAAEQRKRKYSAKGQRELHDKQIRAKQRHDELRRNDPDQGEPR